MTLALLITAVTGAWADGDTKYTVTFKANGNTKTVENVTLPHTFMSVNNQGNGELDLIINDLYNQSEGWCVETPTVSGNSNVTAGLDGSFNQYITISAPFEGNATVSASHFYDNPMSSFTYTLEISIPGYIDGPAVTTNAAEEGATFTEASFVMPTSDVTVDYELVRDMSVKVSAEVGDGSAGYRIRIKKDGNDYVPVNDKEMLVSVSDDLDEQHPIDLTVDTDFTLLVQKKGEGDTWTDISNEDKLSVGTFRYQVTGTGNYTGTIYSNEFVLFEGYQVVIPAGEYVTYYKDEAVRLDEKDKNDIELCTITAIEDGKAVLSDNFDAMKANKPFLLKNTTNEEKTILLIPCNEPDLAVTVAKEFKGTEGACEFSEELMAIADFYVCNGKEFIKVRGKGTLAANKAFLFVEGNNTPASIPFRRSIGGEGEGTTSIDNVNPNPNLNDNEATWYDLNGRRLQGKPSQKGIYIKNGKKVVVH